MNKVDCRRDADQKRRWLAASVLDTEPRLRKPYNYKHLPRARDALPAQASRRLGKVVWTHGAARGFS